mmetsp:Transcript_33669/g.44430  ORF Transcript_33669/g.44430 Transcript_33669/m.44430 type:complete len:98 (-) Transcript_33669:3902-4195(-)
MNILHCNTATVVSSRQSIEAVLQNNSNFDQKMIKHCSIQYGTNAHTPIHHVSIDRRTKLYPQNPNLPIEGGDKGNRTLTSFTNKQKLFYKGFYNILI